ncbi:chromo domain-containing protein LHP1 isoform X1 [Vigna radiata var. radiata]|uniref:Chromo domain-containing protein LHP1 isoform X1 n=1 Tax=Vigna radiata var. radiata TaxID=3916 RepID=A0A1S3TYJ1_VIGRR|nr:chromo domain-containing protein LHP1 isoform X1 [Vigna radiata var. radiata]XP_022636834.1 chromo domain-containing protein LHP1 isoform X1 [Vigna radiata var. radiata]
MKKKMKRNNTSTSISVREGSSNEPSSSPSSPSSSAQFLFHKDNGNGEQTLVPLNPNLNLNLDDGFYEIETIRRRRIRKGQLQYLIKWRGWPETANTWEPLENLQSVPDLLRAFEEDSFRKRKRKHVVHHAKIRKHPQRSTTSYSLRHFPTHNPHSQTPSFPHHPLPTTLPQPQQTNENTFADHHQNDYDPKLCELKATTNTGLELDNLGLHFQQLKVSTAICSHLDCEEPTQTGRCRGAKRRKCGPVKRFKRDTGVGKPVDDQNAISMPVGAVEPGCTRTTGCVGNNSSLKMDDAKTACNIVKILKPIGYSSSLSDNMQDVLVTFMAMRSDGTEVMVNNRYLKAYNPLLLINFYELHLRYCPTL